MRFERCLEAPKKSCLITFHQKLGFCTWNDSYEHSILSKHYKNGLKLDFITIAKIKSQKINGFVEQFAVSLILRHVNNSGLIRLNWLNTQKEFGKIIEEASGIGIVIFTSGVLEIVVALVVEHLVGGQIHGRVQQLDT